jgi:hypothetical protein
MCLTTEKQIDVTNAYAQKVVMDVSVGSEFPGVRTNGGIIVSLDSQKVYSVKLDSYIVALSNSTLIESSGSEGTLYKCSSGTCVKNIIPDDGWYIKSTESGSPEELIYCSDRTCTLRTEVDQGYYVSANKNKPLIQCITPGLSIDGQFEQTEGKNTICYERNYKEGWFLNSDISTNTVYPLIKCSKEYGCTKHAAEAPGWYINNGALNEFSYGSLSNDTVYPIIQCTGISSCSYYTQTFKKECENGGAVISPSSNTYKLCKDTGVSVDFNSLSATASIYQVVIVGSSGDFPGASSGEIVVKTTKYDITQVIQSTDKYYYKDSNVYKFNNGSCTFVMEDYFVLFEQINQSLISS